jgi:hypothetical protein
VRDARLTRRSFVTLAAAATVAGCGGARQLGAARRAAEHEPPERPSAPRPGELPAHGPARVAGLELPDGRRLRDEHGTAVLWRTELRDDEALARWRRLAAAFPTTGLWPVLIQAGELQPEFARPRDWEIQAAKAPERVLRSLWRESLPLGAGERREYAAEVLAPFGAQFPELARGGAPRKAQGTTAEAVGTMEGVGALALVPVTRPADVVGATGWQGPVNHTDDIALLSAVLRSWEERCDAIVVGLSLDTLHLAVRRPPSGDDASLLAAEQKAFCPDIVDQGTNTIGALAAEIDGAPAWYFWWD